MTSDIERYEPPTQLDSWVDVLAPVGDLATRIANTAFVPDSFRGSPAAVAAAILTGRELGIGPLTALRHIHVVKGRPGQSAELMRALILRAGHTIRYIDTTSSRCVVEGRRRGEEDWARVTFTADQARSAKPPIDLSSYPEDKLIARATSRLARRLFADVIAGMPYTADELEDSGEEAVAAAGAARKAQRARRPDRAEAAALPAENPQEQPSLSAPPLPGEDGYEFNETAENVNTHAAGPTDPEQESITPAQLQMLHTTFTELGVTDRDERLATASAAINRDLTTSKDLTKQEASDLITALTQQLVSE